MICSRNTFFQGAGSLCTGRFVLVALDEQKESLPPLLGWSRVKDLVRQICLARIGERDGHCFNLGFPPYRRSP